MNENAAFGSHKSINLKSDVNKHRKKKSISLEALKATIEKKKECNAKALDIVVRFSEGAVDEGSLLENAYFINQCHFQDIIEERAILKHCGYPVCANIVKDVPKKQYHISTKQNKVFDISDRKNFCSNMCYKAAKFLQDQLLTSPLWLRDNEKSISFKLLPLDSVKGSFGIEVDIGDIRVKPEQIDTINNTEDFTSVAEFTRNSLSHLSHKVDEIEEKLEEHDENHDNLKPTKINHDDKECNVMNSPDKIDHYTQEYKQVTHECEETVINEECESFASNKESNLIKSVTETKSYKLDEMKVDDENLSLRNNENKTAYVEQQICNRSGDSKSINEQNRCEDKGTSINRMEKKEKGSVKKEKSKKKIDNEIMQPLVNIVIRIEQSIREWFTIDSLCFLYGEDTVKELLADKGESIKEYQSKSENALVDPYLYERYLAICRKLNVLEVEDSRLENEISENVKTPQKPLPDFSVLLEEAKDMELKVKNFYKGDTKVTFAESTEKNNESRHDPVLPLVDLHAQKSLRRRIVLDKLNRVLFDLTRLLGLKGVDISGGIRTLISTFTLSAHNITFKPLEWHLIALVIIKLLSVKDDLLAQALSSDTGTRHLTLMLMSYQLDGGYLERLIEWLADIDYIIKKSPQLV